MKVLIAHDASDDSDAILRDLQFSGLPAHASVITLSVIGDNLAQVPELEHLRFHSRHFTPTLLRPHTEAHYIKTVLNQHFPDWYVETDILRGDPAEQILSTAKDRNVDLIVVGSHGRTGLHRLLMGSVSAKVAAQATCSVRIVHPRHKHLDHPLSVLLGLDGSKESAQSITTLCERSFPRNTRVHLLHVIDGTMLFEQGPALTIQSFIDGLIPIDAQRVHQMLSFYEPEVKEYYPGTETQIRYGNAASEILRYAHLEEIDSIFLGPHGEGHSGRDAFGSVAQFVSQRAETTVEIVRR